MIKTVYLGKDNPTIVTFYKNGTVINFAVVTRFVVKFRENDLVVDTDQPEYTDLITGDNQGKVSFKFGNLAIEPSTYTIELTIYDPDHTDGQIIVDYTHDLKFKFIENFDFDLVIQDSEGTQTESNSYIDIDYFKSYHRIRGNDYQSYDDFQIKTALVKSLDYIDLRFDFVSSEKTNSQNTKWPRAGYDIIPRAIKEAQAEYALRALSININPDPENISGGRLIKSKTEGFTPISESIEYESNTADFLMPNYPAADEKIRRAGLIKSSSIKFLMRG